MTFHPLPGSSADELEALTGTIAARVTRLLVCRGPWLEDDDGGRPADVDELMVLASIHEASVTQRGETGAPLRRIGATLSLLDYISPTELELKTQIAALAA